MMPAGIPLCQVHLLGPRETIVRALSVQWCLLMPRLCRTPQLATLEIMTRPPPRRLVLAACEVLGVTPEQALEAYGTYFISYVTEMVRPLCACGGLVALGLSKSFCTSTSKLNEKGPCALGCGGTGEE